MLVERIYDEDLAHATWFIACQKRGEALVIDPARDIDRYLEFAASKRLRISAVAETHIHADFLSGSAELATATGATCYLSAHGGEDWSYKWFQNTELSVKTVEDGDSFTIGNITVKVMHTPGHTPEHICFIVHDASTSDPIAIASGDFMFVGDLGRPDLLETAAGIEGVMENCAKDLYASCKIFLGQEDYIQIWPAHGAGSACGKALGAIPMSTLGYEKRTSPPLQLMNDEQAFVSFMLEDQPEPPLYFARMKRMNRDGVPLLGGLPTPNQITNVSELVEMAVNCTVIDTRSWGDVMRGHLPNSIWSTANGNFHRFAGSFVEADEKILFIVEPSQLDRAIRNAIRIGLDEIIAWASPDLIEQVKGLSTVDEIDSAELDSRFDCSRLDVRKASEFQEGAIEGATNIAHTRLLSRLIELDKSKPLIVNCQGGTRSAAACMALKRCGFEVTNLAGGYGGYANFHSSSPVAQ